MPLSAPKLIKDDPYLQTVWTTENGLPQNSVNAIVQSRDGWLWLGTYGGLIRFDGVKFTTFNSGNTPGLKSNRILSLCEDSNGTLWMGTDSGAVMSFRNGEGQTWGMPDGLPGGVVWTVYADRQHTIWAGTPKGLARLRDGKFQPVTASSGFPETQVWEIQEDATGHLLISTSAGLVEFANEKFTLHQAPEGMPAGLWVPLRARQAGGAWLATAKGLAQFQNGKFVSLPNSYSRPDWKIRSIFVARDDSVWISYFQPSSLFRYTHGQFSSYELKAGHEVVKAVYEDREGNIWVGTDGGGLSRLRRRNVTTITQSDGLLSNSVRAVTDDGAGGLWITTGAGLAHCQSGACKTFSNKDGMQSYEQYALLRDRHNDLWIGSNYGLTQYKDGHFINYPMWMGAEPLSVNALAEDSDGSIWLGTMDGLRRFRNGEFTAVRQADGLAHDNVRFVLPMPDGGLWVGTVSGLSYLRNGKITNYTNREGLSNEYVRAIQADADGTVWIGTYGGGINRFRHGQFKAITAQDGLFDDFVSRILEDGHGNFWLLGNRGIFRVSRQELNDFADGNIRNVSCVSYGIADGMISSEGNGGAQPAGWRMPDGKLCFTTIKGLVIIDPKESNTLAPSVQIEQVKLDQSVLSAPDFVRVKPGQESVEIEYTALSLRRADQVKFKYQLVGLDQDWIEAGPRRTAYYSHLPPGEYTFKVIAENGEGVWNREGKSLRVIVLPPFYRTWWFITLATLSLIGFVVGAWQFRVRQLRKVQRTQQAFSHQLIASQEAERKRIAAELHDSLGQRLIVIKNLAFMSLQTPGFENGARQHIEEISQETSAAISEVREISYNLRPYQLDRIGLTKAIESIVRMAQTASDITFTSSLDPIDDVFPKDAEINFYRLVQESINNILKHSKATKARVLIQRRPKQLQLTIQDNGKGFVPGEANTNGPRGGFGLIGITERAHLLGGKPYIQSAPGQGTTINIEINLEKLHEH